MAETFKAEVQERGRIQIPQLHFDLLKLKAGEIVLVTIEKGRA